MKTRNLCLSTLSMLVGLALALPAQRRVIDLTGQPSTHLSTPLSAVSHGVEMSNGEFVFVDRVEITIHSADLSRDEIQSHGRTGSGPGEYRRPTRAIADGKGGAFLPDEAGFRMLHLRPAGRLVDADLPLQQANIHGVWIRGVDPQGRILHWGPMGRTPRGTVPISRWDPSTGASTLLGNYPTAVAALGAPTRTSRGVSREIMTQSLWPLRGAWVPLSDGSAAVIYPQPYHVEMIRPDGTTIRGPDVEYQPVRVTAALRAEVRSERPVSDDQFPDELPPFEGFDDVIGSPQGEVWVGRMQGSREAIVIYDLFNADGIRFGTARLRPHSKVVGFGAGSIYVARQDADEGLWYLERYSRR